MKLQQAQQELSSRLQSLYDAREAATIADWTMEKITGRKKVDRLVYKQEALTPAQEEAWERYTAELLTHRPVQYVLQEAWFCGIKFYVDEQVLIPRPETEELVDWVARETGGAGSLTADHSPGRRSLGEGDPLAISLLDVGTGSGCIAIALQKKLSAARPGPAAPVIVHACDTSASALAVARRNAADNGAGIHFHLVDFLAAGEREALPRVDLLVSNPPYIPAREKDSMAPHVTEFEPHLALFVENDDPLLFYKALALFAKDRLLPGGSIFAEIHEDLASPVLEVFRDHGFPFLTLKKDLQGKDRMIKATR